MKIDKKIIKELVDYLNEFNLTELEYKDGDKKVKVSKNFSNIVQSNITKNQTQSISEIVRNRCSVKAVGGIKTFDQAIEIIEAGSTYIGTSFGFEITQEQKKKKE